MRGRIVLNGSTYIVAQKDLSETTIITVADNLNKHLLTLVSDSSGQDVVITTDGEMVELDKAAPDTQTLLIDIIIEWVG